MSKHFTPRPTPRQDDASLSARENESALSHRGDAPNAPNAPDFFEVTSPSARYNPSLPTHQDDSTHIVVRSRRDKFNRAGLRFSNAWSAHEVASLTDEQLELLKAEPELEVRMVDAGEAEQLTSQPAIDGAISASKAGLLDEVRRLKIENQDLRARLDSAELAAKGDKPPKPGTPVIGTDVNPLPTPPLPSR